jgi:hypothetical protein
MYPIFFGGFVALIGTGFCIWLFTAYLRVLETYDWTETPCEITDARIEKSRFSKSSPVTYELKVEYRYRAGGMDRTSSKIRRRDGSKRKPSRDYVEEVAQEYAEGTAQVCYVNPKNPDEAVLEHDSKAVGYVIWFPGLFVVGGLGIMISALRRKAR